MRFAIGLASWSLTPLTWTRPSVLCDPNKLSAGKAAQVSLRCGNRVKDNMALFIIVIAIVIETNGSTACKQESSLPAKLYTPLSWPPEALVFLLFLLPFTDKSANRIQAATCCSRGRHLSGVRNVPTQIIFDEPTCARFVGLSYLVVVVVIEFVVVDQPKRDHKRSLHVVIRPASANFRL